MVIKMYFKTILCIGILFMGLFSAASRAATTEKAIFAGGCFWCIHAQFEELPGVSKVLSGYSGGKIANPTYEQVSSGTTGHVEVIEIQYDPARVSYQQLLDVFWRNIDPTDAEGQFCDKGSQYHAGIFYTSPVQQQIAVESIKALENLLKIQVKSFIRPAMPFYPAEDYHQSFYKKNAARYNAYKKGCGRDERLEELWRGK
jgi:peptide-methionine (S)-S-oxide reductase